MVRTLVLTVDRDNDLGIKTAIRGPVIGRKQVLTAALRLGIADPEESDTNAILGALHQHDALAENNAEGDDVEIAMGGTIAKYVDEGHNVTIITAILPKENRDGKIDDFMSKNRIKEQKNSAKILGAKLDVLDLDPYEFSFSRKYIKIFDKKINEHKPDIIFSCWEHDTHQDHQAMSKILYVATRKNTSSLYMYETMIPGGISSHAFNPQYIVNISNHIDMKLNSIRCYESVFKQNTNKLVDSIGARSKYRGEQIGVEYAEAFQVVKDIVL